MDWINKVKLNTIQRETVTINLLDESGSPVKTWEVVNAWPKKITVEGFKADGNTAAIETFGTGARRCEYSEEVIWLILLHHNLPLNGFRPSHFTFR